MADSENRAAIVSQGIDRLVDARNRSLYPSECCWSR